jgi:hypothetical protein
MKMEMKMKIKVKTSKKTAKRKAKRTTKPRRATRRTKSVPIVVVETVQPDEPPVVVVRSVRVKKFVQFKTQDPIRGNVSWAFDEAKRLVGCDLCEAGPGDPCFYKKRHRLLATLHTVRLNAYRLAIGSEDYQLRHGGSTVVGLHNVELEKDGVL